LSPIESDVLKDFIRLWNCVPSSWSLNNLGDPCNKWSGIICNNNHIIGIDSSAWTLTCQMSGVIPDSIGNLTQLQSLNLPKCGLHGTVPSSFDSLTLLQNLDLSGNLLSGSIFNTLKNLPYLQTLNLNANAFAGGIPFLEPSCPSLYMMNISYNYFNGTIPTWLSSCINLTILDLSHNILTGDVPSSLGQLHNLEVLDLSNNLLYDVFPYYIRSKRLFIQNNQIHGTMFGYLSFSVVELNADNNLLNGYLPDIPVQNTVFELLSVRSNQLDGNIPASYVNSKSLKELHFDSNVLMTGIMPPDLLSNKIPEFQLTFENTNLYCPNIEEWQSWDKEKKVCHFIDPSYDEQLNQRVLIIWGTVFGTLMLTAVIVASLVVKRIRDRRVSGYRVPYLEDVPLEVFEARN